MEYQNAVTKLTNNPNIAIQKAEKIKKFVILDEEFYFEQLVKCNHSDSICMLKLIAAVTKTMFSKLNGIIDKHSECLRSQTTFWSLFLSVLKAIILETFNEIVLAFLPGESKTNILYVDINFTGNLFFGFGRYCGNVVPEPAVSHPFWTPLPTKNVLSVFFSR